MSKYYEEVPFIYPKDTPSSSEDKFLGDGWSVTRENRTFFFSYLSGQLQGENRKIEISKSDFEGAKHGRIQFDEMCRKYRVN